MIDLTLPIHSDTPTFPGYAGFQAQEHVSDTTGARSHSFRANTHLGTHIDAPAHFIEDGATIDEIDPKRWVGTARIVGLQQYQGEVITDEILESVAPELPSEEGVVLISGDVDEMFGSESFFEDATVLDESAADWLVSQDISLVANDFLTESIDDPARPVHHRLLGAEIPIVEYMANTTNLVEYEAIELVATPLRLAGLEAAPARVLGRPVS